MSRVILRSARQGRHTGISVGPVLAVTICLTLPTITWGATKSSAAKSPTKPEKLAVQADNLVKEALYREIYGATSERERLLEEARKLAPKNDAAMWHSGYVKYKDRWTKAEDVPELVGKDVGLARYYARRAESPDTMEGHRNLARWCEKQGLNAQARAHFNRVLEFNGDDAEARQKLGFRRLNRVWVAEASVKEIEDQARQIARSMQEWLPRIQQIRRGLQASSAATREAAQRDLNSIDDLQALPAMERTLSGASEECAVALVNKLADWNDPQATRALARQAVYSSWQPVRQLASHQLRDRPREEFVPTMLEALSTPLQAQTAVVARGGQLVAREMYYREGQTGRELLVLDTAYRLVPQSGSEGPSTLAMAASDMRLSIGGRRTAAAMQNAQSEELNRRVMESLGIATGKKELTRVEDWWKWWNEENEVTGPDLKPLNAEYAVRNVTLVEQPRPSSTSPPLTLVTGPTVSAECLVAGTEIWTLRGAEAIENVRVGDIVLSQNTETGEIAYKPVIATTVRPAGPTFVIETIGETIRTSGGHLFWVAGEGWVKARHLRSGQELHCATGTVRVSLVQESTPEPTYNVVVEDFNTYFVGPEQVLTHDVMLRRPSRAIVPGLLRE